MKKTIACGAILASLGAAPAVLAANSIDSAIEGDYPLCGAGETLHCKLQYRDIAEVVNEGPERLVVYYSTVQSGRCVGRKSGTEYIVKGAATLTRNYQPDATPFKLTFENQFNLIGQGTRPNERFAYRGQATITASGDLSVSFDRIRNVCR